MATHQLDQPAGRGAGTKKLRPASEDESETGREAHELWVDEAEPIDGLKRKKIKDVAKRVDTTSAGASSTSTG